MVSAGALRLQPAVHQEPPRSMAEKPQIQLFIKVRGVLRSVPQASGQPWQIALANNPGSAVVGWLGCPCPLQMSRCEHWAGRGADSGQRVKHWVGNAADSRQVGG